MSNVCLQLNRLQQCGVQQRGLVAPSWPVSVDTKLEINSEKENRLWICSVIVRRTKTSPSSEWSWADGWRPWRQLKNRRQVNREVDLSIILRHNVTSGSSCPSQPTMNDLVLECLRTRQNKHWMDHFSLSSSTRNNGSIETFPVNATIPPFTFLLQSSAQVLLEMLFSRLYLLSHSYIFILPPSHPLNNGQRKQERVSAHLFTRLITILIIVLDSWDPGIRLCWFIYNFLATHVGV